MALMAHSHSQRIIIKIKEFALQSTAFLPKEFLSLVETIIPNHLNMDDFITMCNTPLRKSIRVNTLKITVLDFSEKMQAQGWQLEAIPWCETGFWLQRPDSQTTPLGNTAEHLAGLFYIQEASSMLPVSALVYNNPDLELILDMAAAPGSKTTQIAACLDNTGAIIANEYSSSRVKVLAANIQRCGITNTAITHFDGKIFGEWLPEMFDAILLDAPCSGEGTLRKDPNAMKNWDLSSIQTIASVQKELIKSAFYALKTNGTLIYSTCTLNQQENQEICLYLKKTFDDAVVLESLDNLFPHAHKALTPEGFLHVFPQVYDSEGFFIARIKKTAQVTPTKIQTYKGIFPFSPLSQKQQQLVRNALSNSFHLSLPTDKTLWRRDKEIWLFPNSITPILGKIRLERTGLKLADIFNKGKKEQYRWQHAAIMALTDYNHHSMLEVTTELAREWYMGRDIKTEIKEGMGEVIISYQGYPIGIGKWVRNKIKNKYPRELVRDNNLFI